jgi:UDP-glucose 4-epimerase
MAKYLVTGIAGFIGSSIAHELLSRGETVRGLDDFSTGKWANIVDIQNDIDFRQVSLLDKPALASACAGIDYVVHQAALPSVPKSVAEPELTHAVNVNGTLNLLLAARDAGVKRLVYAASSSAYGESEVLPKREDMLPRPISPYAVQKLAGEYYLQTFSAVYGLETVSLRYFNIFGRMRIRSSPAYWPSLLPRCNWANRQRSSATASRAAISLSLPMLFRPT